MSDKNPLARLSDYGQSVWYDNIHRQLLEDGTLERYIREDDLRGLTSNPSIFEKAVAGGEHYDADLKALLAERPKAAARDLFYALAIEDIRRAADHFRPVYEASGGRDGMVSLEISPDLAHEPVASVEEAIALHQRVDRPNLMIKVPATPEGLPVIEALISQGIHVNATLLFSVDRYLATAEAFINGLKARQKRGLPISGIHSVASFFVSRVDNALDPLLADKAPELQGKMAIYNAKRAYARYRERFAAPDFQELRSKGAAPQRLLWASTGVKNPAYRDTLYLETLIGEDTVTTVPPATYEAFRDHGRVAPTLTQGLDEAEEQWRRLEGLGIDTRATLDQLERDGVAAFEKSFANLLTAIENKAEHIVRAA